MAVQKRSTIDWPSQEYLDPCVTRLPDISATLPFPLYSLFTSLDNVTQHRVLMLAIKFGTLAVKLENNCSGFWNPNGCCFIYHETFSRLKEWKTVAQNYKILLGVLWSFYAINECHKLNLTLQTIIIFYNYMFLKPEWIQSSNLWIWMNVFMVSLCVNPVIP